MPPSFFAAEHGGTHIDAPIHFAGGRRTVDAMPVDQLIGPAAVVDVSEAAQAGGDNQVSIADLDQLPPTGTALIALPMKIEGGRGGPLRAVAFVPVS